MKRVAKAIFLLGLGFVLGVRYVANLHVKVLRDASATVRRCNEDVNTLYAYVEDVDKRMRNAEARTAEWHV